MTYIMDDSDERLRELMRALADTIGKIINGNDEIRSTLDIMAEEGYSVDTIIASITVVSSSESDEEDTIDTDEKVSCYDRSFLKKIHVRLGETE